MGRGCWGITWDRRGYKCSEGRGNGRQGGAQVDLGTACRTGRLRSWKPAYFALKGGRDLNPSFDKLNTAIAHPAHWSWDLWFVLLVVFANFSQCFKMQQMSDHKTVYD